MSSVLALLSSCLLTLVTSPRATDECDHELRSHSGQIRSPNFPDSYLAGENCQWVVTVGRGKAIEITIDFPNDPGRITDGDTVAVYDTDPLNSTFAATLTTHGQTFYSPHGKLWIMLIARNQTLNETRSAFRLIYNSSSVPSAPLGGSADSQDSSWALREAAGCEHVFTNTTGFIDSQDYNLTDCNYTICFPEFAQISLDFNLLNASSSTRVFIDANAAYWSLRELRANETNFPFHLRLNASRISVTFRRRASAPYLRFTVSYSALGDGEACDGPISLPHGRVAERFESSAERLAFTCDSLFTLDGPNASACSSSPGAPHWSPPLPACRCGGVLNAAEGIVSFKDLLPLGDTPGTCAWTFTDVDTYVYDFTFEYIYMDGNDSLTVSDSTGVYDLWSLCSQNCSQWTLTLGSVFANITFRYNPQASTKTDFRLRFQRTDRTACQSPSVPKNGGFIGSDFTLGAVVRYICDAPYDILGYSEPVCELGLGGVPTWSHSSPTCVVPECKDSSMITHRHAGQGALVTPGYPNKITGGRVCRWKITANPPFSVFLYFHLFDVPLDLVGKNLLQVSQLIGSKRVMRELKADAQHRNITTRSQEVLIVYTGPENDVVSHKGIYIEYSAVIPSPAITTDDRVNLTSYDFFLTTEMDTNLSMTTDLTDSSPSLATGETETRFFSTSVQPAPSQETGALVPSTHEVSREDSSLATTASHNQHLTDSDSGSSNGRVIAVAIIIPTLIIAVVGIAVYVWYRKKYPVRMIIGKEFAQFTNPAYAKSTSTTDLAAKDGANPRNRVVSLVIDLGEKNKKDINGQVNPGFDDDEEDKDCRGIFAKEAADSDERPIGWKDDAFGDEKG